MSDLLMTRCHSCSSLNVCDFSPLEKGGFDFCGEVVSRLREGLPNFLAGAYDNYRFYRSYFNRIKQISDFELLEDKAPCIIKLSNLSYERAMSLLQRNNNFPWVLFYLDRPPQEIVENIIIASQLFNKDRTVLLFPIRVLKEDMDRNFFILNQAGISLVLCPCDLTIEDFLYLGEKWIQFGNSTFYPFSIYFREFFSRISGLPYFYNDKNQVALELFHYYYKDLFDLKGKFLQFCYDVVDTDSLFDFILKAYSTMNKPNLEGGKDSLLSLEKELRRFQLIDNIVLSSGVVFNNEFLSFDYLMKTDESFFGRVFLDFSEDEYNEMLSLENSKEKVYSRFFTAEEIVFNIDKVSRDETLYSLLNFFNSYPFAFYVSYSNSFFNYFDKLLRFRRSIIVGVKDFSELRSLVDYLFNRKEVDVFIEPVGTMFIMLLEGESQCSFLEKLYPGIYEEGILYLKSRIKQILA
ncbi:MAG: hypothetical protein QXS74_08460 [Nitrososphaeria archaeon]